MGCNFSVSVCFGAKVRGSHIPWKNWTFNEDDCTYEEIRPFQVIDHGGYTDREKYDVIIGKTIVGPVEENTNDYESEGIDHPDPNGYFETKDLDDLLVRLQIPYESIGLWLVSDWS